jgi:hypothetical protein
MKQVMTASEQKDNEQKVPNCSECDNVNCKCDQIMANVSNNIELSYQIGHHTLYNIFLTIFMLLQYLNNHESDLVKIEKICQKIYSDLNPKETGHTIN